MPKFYHVCVDNVAISYASGRVLDNTGRKSQEPPQSASLEEGSWSSAWPGREGLRGSEVPEMTCKGNRGMPWSWVRSEALRILAEYQLYSKDSTKRLMGPSGVGLKATVCCESWIHRSGQQRAGIKAIQEATEARGWPFAVCFQIHALIHVMILKFRKHPRRRRPGPLRPFLRSSSARSPVAGRNLMADLHRFLEALSPCTSSSRVGKWFILRRNLFPIKNIPAWQ